MCKKKKKIMAVLIFALLFSLCSSTGIWAMESERMPPLNPDETGSMDVLISYEDKQNKENPVGNVGIIIYQVAELQVNNGSTEYMLPKDFEDTKIDFNGMNTEESQVAAERLFKQAESFGLKGKLKKTDASGHAVFENLNQGMYLVVRDSLEKTDNFKMSPFLVSVPMAQIDGIGWDYSVEARPKVISGETQPSTPETEPETEEPLTPDKGTPPKTGDTVNPVLWIVIGAVSVIALILTGGMLAKMRKKR